MTKRIVIVSSTGLAKERIEEVRSRFPHAVFVMAEDTLDSIHKCVPGANALIGCPRKFFSVDMIDRAGPSLRWVHVPGAGCEEFILPEILERNIILTNGRIIQGPEVADHAIALLLALTRNIHFVLRGHSDVMPRPIELRKKTALVIGLGGVGLLIAERLSAFGMRVLGIDPEYIPMLRTLDRILPPARLLELLPLADVVVMSAPATTQSVKMFGSREFSAMRSGAYFINVSRGKTVDTDALTGALHSKHLGAAGLDVTDPEPLPDNHPLRAMNNVIITPHIAGPSDHNRERSLMLTIDNLERFLSDLPMLNVVDTIRGY